jgi:hypothetical protein
MRLALIAPCWVPIPPPLYGGTETVVDRLAKGFHAAGHDVLAKCVTGLSRMLRAACSSSRRRARWLGELQVRVQGEKALGATGPAPVEQD